jgi:hypothetical protein
MKEKKDKSKKPKRGIETMFRIIAEHHQRLSEMADNKSHIMITVNSIILSVVITVLLRRIEEYTHMTIPAILLLGVNVSTLVMSVLATRPSIPKKKFAMPSSNKKDTNLMFFGNFYHLGMSEYVARMKLVMSDSDYLYKSLTEDVYSQGVILTRKYKMLRIAYNIFMFGIVGCVIAFLIAAFRLWEVRAI